MSGFGKLLGDGRIMTLGFAGIAAFLFTALVGWALGLGREPVTPIAAPVMGDTTQYVWVPGVTGRLPGAVRESSGVALAQFAPALIWTHNDGSDGRVFLVRPSGSIAGILHVVGAEVDDAEDIDVGPCPAGVDASSCLYLADTGDNDRDRDEYRILFAPEPTEEQFINSIRANLTMSAIRYRYPGESRDAEALAITGSGEVLVVTKGQEGAADVFSIPTDGAGSADVVTAVHRATLPLNVDDKDARITAAAIDDRTDRLAVRSDEKLFVFETTEGESIVRRCDLPDAGQGEGVDFISDSLFILTQEGSPAPIEVVRCL